MIAENISGKLLIDATKVYQNLFLVQRHFCPKTNIGWKAKKSGIIFYKLTCKDHLLRSKLLFCIRAPASHHGLDQLAIPATIAQSKTLERRNLINLTTLPMKKHIGGVTYIWQLHKMKPQFQRKDQHDQHEDLLQ